MSRKSTFHRASDAATKSRRTWRQSKPAAVTSFSIYAMAAFPSRSIRFDEDPPNAPAPVSAEEFSKLQASLNTLQAQVRILTKAPPQAAPAPEPNEPTMKEQIAALRKTLADRDLATAEEKKSAALNAGISAHGIAGVAAEDLRAFLVLNHSKQIKEVNGAYVYEDPQTAEVLPIDEFLSKKILVGDRKDRYATSPKKGGTPLHGPGSKTPTTGRVFYSQLSPDARDKMTAAERSAYLSEDMKASKG